MKRYVLIFFSLFFSFGLLAQPIKVMTYNIRYYNLSDGGNAWIFRKESVEALIKNSNPDILCLQEVMFSQLKDLLKALPNYEWVGVGRDDGIIKGEYCPIFYKKSRFESIQLPKYVWLSETPDKPGSISWDAKVPRMLTRATIRDKKTGDVISVFNTHFDDWSENHRNKSAVQLLNEIRKSNKATIIVAGDFSTPPVTDCYNTLINGGLKDTRPIAQAQLGPDHTFNDFKTRVINPQIIDHIFVKSINPIHVHTHTIVDAKFMGRIPSDHYPVVIDLSLGAK
ncbi:MAG: endonuclease/exonuclease/phosphatase family protein [Bacteroidetes bacterium]|nr:endonuclease/exonuclease/phosphatase family protein [Bacteroidota bacterium]